MADIKKFSGYTAIDGKPFDTLKGATDYSREIKVKLALETSFSEGSFHACDTGVCEDERGGTVIYPEAMPAWLYANRVAIMAAFKQDVLMRAPRKPRDPAAPPRAAKVKVVPASIAGLVVPPAPRKSGMSEHPGVLDLDEPGDELN